jgi:hypothetical protein
LFCAVGSAVPVSCRVFYASRGAASPPARLSAIPLVEKKLEKNAGERRVEGWV